MAILAILDEIMSWSLGYFDEVLNDSNCLLVSILGLLVVYLSISSLLESRKLPPGPWGLPLIGYAPFIGKTPHVKLSKLAEKYGDIISVNVAGRTVIHLNSFEAIREALVKKGDEFTGKPQDISLHQWIADWQGIGQSEGPAWKEHRRFTLHTLRDFGFGKQSLEQRVLSIAGDILKTLEDSKGEPLDIYEDISNCANNVINSLLFDKHYARDDPEFLEIREGTKSVLNLFTGVSLSASSPLTKILPLNWIPPFMQTEPIKGRLRGLIGERIKEHEETFDPNFLRDYFDAYLDERRKLKEEGKLEESTFSIDRLIGISINLLTAGTETVASTMYWAFKLMMVHQEVQKKIQAEIDEVVGKERQPSITDRSKMPYTVAAIAEIYRFSSILAIGPVHSNPEETTLLGYTIPKRSLIMANLWAVHRDAKCYVDPDEFQPTRFLEPDGMARKVETLIPFSIGKRSCLGEALARMEVFLFLTSVLQRFNLEHPEGVVDKSFECLPSVLRVLNAYKICAKPRS